MGAENYPRLFIVYSFILICLQKAAYKAAFEVIFWGFYSAYRETIFSKISTTFSIASTVIYSYLPWKL